MVCSTCRSPRTATGLDTGIATLGITDVDLPDLVVSSVTAPASGYDNAPLNISWTVTNSGQYLASGSWLDQVYLDPVGGPQSDTPGRHGHIQRHGQCRPELHPDRHAPVPLDRRPVHRARRDRQRPERAGAEFLQQHRRRRSAAERPGGVHRDGHTTATTVSNGTPIVLSGVATMTSNGAPAADCARGRADPGRRHDAHADGHDRLQRQLQRHLPAASQTRRAITRSPPPTRASPIPRCRPSSRSSA